MRGPLFIFILILLLIGCKAPKNALDLGSFPKNYIVKNSSDPIFTKTYEDLGKVYNEYLIRDTSAGTQISFYVVFVDDTIVGLFNKLDFNSNLCLESAFDITQQSEPSTQIGCDLLYSVFSEDRTYSSVVHPSIINNRKGHKFQAIERTFHLYMQSYFNSMYQNFNYDNMESWNPTNYTKIFSSKEKSLLNFINLSILYYKAFPEKMNEWPSDVSANMKLLIANYAKSLDELYELQEVFVAQDYMCKVFLLQLLKYRITNKGIDYRAA